MAECVKAYLRYDPKLGPSPAEDWVKTYEVGKDVRWADGKLRIEFDGSRVEVIGKPDETERGVHAASTSTAATSLDQPDASPSSTLKRPEGRAPAAVRIDGRKPSEFAELYEFDAITAAVLGGTSLFGGRGKVFPGTVLGAVLVKSIFNGLVIVQADPYLYPLITSAIIFVAVLLDSLRSDLITRLSRRMIRVEGR